MKIREIRSLRGANYWSKGPVVKMVLEMGELEPKKTTDYPGLVERLLQLMPSLAEHRCAQDQPGGFLDSLRQGTSLAHVIEHLCLELQYQAYLDVYFCKSYPTKEPGVHLVVFEYWVEEAGIYAGEEAVRIIGDLIDGKPDEEIDIDGVVREINRMEEAHYLGPTSMAIIDEAKRQGISVFRLDDYNIVQLGEGKYQKRIQASLTSHTSVIATELAGNKKVTKLMLRENGIPVPQGTVATKFSSVLEDAHELGYPVVLKPYDGHHGKGVTINIKNDEQLKEAFDRAKEISHRVIVEKMVSGRDFRILVVDGRFIAAANRIPAYVKGDGQHTIKQLIEIENRNPRRGPGHENVMTYLGISEVTQGLFAERGIDENTVLPPGEVFHLERTANLSTGGSAIDVTHRVHPANKFMFERVARIIGLDVAGIDVIAPDLDTPLAQNGGVVIEVNAAPGLRMHISPSEGKSRNVAEPIINMLFPPGSEHDIKIISVTGTNGKTTTVRLINHIMKGTGLVCGMTNTDGVYIRDRLILAGDMSGPRSARMVLEDPTVECAVLETARGGLLRSGLGYGTADVGICMNVAEDHIGLGYIETVEDLARLKSLVPATVRRGGYSVLNADDKWCRWMEKECHEHIVWFSLNPQNPTVLEHVEHGGLAVVYQNGYITVLDGEAVVPVARAYEIPITMEGKAVFNIQNAMAATAAAYALKVRAEEIRVGLSSFFPSPSQTPGRMNLIPIKGYSVMIDYAHNPRAYANIFDLIAKMDCRRRILVLDAVGDRRDEDIEHLAAISARYADHIIVYEDKDLRGRQPGEIASILRRGLEKSGYPAERVEEVLDEFMAADRALSLGQAGDLIIYMTGRVQQAIKYIYDYKEKVDPVAAPSVE